MFATHQILHFTTILFILTLHTTITCFATTFLPQELLKGFSAVPLSTPTSFQPLLTDSTGNFSLGFLRHNQNKLQLAVVHAASYDPFWIAKQTPPASWSDTTRLFFNGSLVLWDSQTGASWSTATNGDRVVLLNTSSLQVQNKNKDKDKETPLWESFHFPTNTLVEGQNLTSTMSLVSSNNLYSLQLSDNFMGLYANYNEEKRASLSKRLLYWKRTPLEAKAEIKEGQGPIYARVSNEGYLGMYQTSTKPVDVQKFNTFQQTSSFLVVRLEPDGNLKGYYWDVAKSTWQLNFQAITETCDLPNPCGSYGLCTPGGSGCSCLDNKTRFEAGEPGGCLTGEKDDQAIGNLCGKGISTGENGYNVMRKNGVEAPHKELLGHVTTSSLEECEGLCKKNCSCWGAMYSNITRVCYILEYPIRSMLGSGDESKVGYFKVKKGVEKKNKVVTVVSVLVGIVVFVVMIIGVGIWVVRLKRRKRMMKVVEENGASPGPYRNLGSASFRSIEMCSSHGNGE